MCLFVFIRASMHVYSCRIMVALYLTTNVIYVRCYKATFIYISPSRKVSIHDGQASKRSCEMKVATIVRTTDALSHYSVTHITRYDISLKVSSWQLTIGITTEPLSLYHVSYRVKVSCFRQTNNHLKLWNLMNYDDITTKQSILYSAW